MSQSNSDRIKQDVDFLRHDVNLKNDYQLVKSGRSVLNLKKEQLFKTSHGQVLNYFLNCKNNYSEYPFNGSSSFYVDFDIPKGIQHTVYQFILRFAIQNKGTVDGDVMASPLIIEKVSLLKNSIHFFSKNANNRQMELLIKEGTKKDDSDHFNLST